MQPSILHSTNNAFFVLFYISHRTPYSNIKKFKAVFIGLFSFINLVTIAQIPSFTLDASFPFATGNSYSAFEMPTSTDAILIGTAPMHIAISTATTPYTELHYNYNNGTLVGSTPIQIPSFGTRHVYLDDVVLTFDGGSSINAYITCRVENGNTTDIYIVNAFFNGSQFVVNPTPLNIDTRTEPAIPDYFDRISIAHAPVQQTQDQELGIVYRKDDNIVVGSCKVNPVLGTLSFDAVNGAFTLFTGNSTAYPGRFSNPDISTGSMGHFVVSALYEYGNSKSVIVKASAHGPFDGVSGTWFAPSTAYTVNSPVKKIRTPRVDDVSKYQYAVCFNELSLDGNRSEIKLVVAGHGGASPSVPTQSATGPPSAALVINNDIENLCLNNTNYFITGFPIVRFLDEDYIFCEVAWQQVMCTEGVPDFCDVQAISKRFQITYPANNTAPTIAPLNNNEYFFISRDKASKVSVFPSFVALRANCRNFYSFGKMDPNTSANGTVVYKQSTCNGTSLRPMVANNQNSKAGAGSPCIVVYPNPGKGLVHVSAKGFAGNATMFLYNAMGSLIATINVKNESTIDIDTHAMASGNYLIKVIDAGGRGQHKKIIIIK